MDDLIRRVDENIFRHRLLGDGSSVLVAVSGGLDSMVLLRVLCELVPLHGWKIFVAHFNHQLRGRAANADQRLVERTAKKSGLRCRCGSADVRKLAREGKLSLEMAARASRHGFLAQAAREFGTRNVALAHHADDQVELFFLRLLRGASSDGLGGMRWKSVSSSDRALTLVRPLLDVPKKTLADFARERRIEFREDASNRSNLISRNRVRHELLPLLRRTYQPNLDAVASRTMELLRAEAEFVTSEAERWLRASKRKPFAMLAIALQRRVLELQLRRAGNAPAFELIERLRLNKNAWTAVDAQRLCRLRSNGQLETRISEANSFQRECQHLSLDAKVKRVAFGSRQLSWKLTRGNGRPPPKPGVEFFDADAIGNEVVLRYWRAGDRFQPIGMAHEVKLQDFFVNQKIPRNSRYGLVIATTEDNHIFWVGGLRIGERFKITAATRRVLQWNWRGA